MKNKQNQENQKKSILTTIIFFWKVLCPEITAERRNLFTAMFFAVIASSIGLALPLIVQIIIDTAIPQKNTHLLIKYSIVIISTLIVVLFIWYIHVIKISRASENIFRDFKLRLASDILNKNINFFNKYQASDILTRVANDVELISDFFYKHLIHSIIEIIFGIIILMYMLVWQPLLTLIILLGFPLCAFIIFFFDISITKASRKSREKLSLQNEDFLDLVLGNREIRFFQKKKFFIEKLKKSVNAYAEETRILKKIMGISENTIEMAGMIVAAMPVIVGGLLICFGYEKITIGVIIAFQAYALILAKTIDKVTLSFAELIKAKPCLERVNEIFLFPSEEIIPPLKIEDIPEKMTLEFKNVCFGYIKEKNIINNFNLKIEPGEKICIMGKSGTGKTTIANLLLRFIKPTSGEILLGGKNIEIYPLNSYLSFFSYVWQDTFLFKMSIKENIAIGWYNVSETDIFDAVERIGLKETVEALPEKYNTVIGSAGFNFSGGQRQRISLARIYIRGPEILVLDEFTSALDTTTEQKILDDVFSVFKKQSIICITHSETVAARFDKLIKL